MMAFEDRIREVIKLSAAATLADIALAMRLRSTIERHFAWAKRYFGLESARWAGLVAAYPHTALVYATMLAVALLAHRYQRPELAGSRTRVLALKTIT